MRLNQPYLHLLYRPMLVISLGLHGLLLSIPIPSESKKSEPATQKKEDTVKISQLLAPSPQPSPQPSKPSSKPTPKPINKAIPPKATPSSPPKVVNPTPIVTQKSTPTPQLTPTPEPSATTTPTDEVAQAEFQGLFGQVQGEAAEELVDHNLFKEPALFYSQESLAAENPQRQSGIEKIKWVTLKSPDQVFAESVEPELKTAGIKPAVYGEYGGGNLYQVKKGNFVRYINLVPTKGSVGTLIIVWSRDPNTN